MIGALLVLARAVTSTGMTVQTLHAALLLETSWFHSVNVHDDVVSMIDDLNKSALLQMKTREKSRVVFARHQQLHWHFDDEQSYPTICTEKQHLFRPSVAFFLLQPPHVSLYQTMSLSSSSPKVEYAANVCVCYVHLCCAYLLCILYVRSVHVMYIVGGRVSVGGQVSLHRLGHVCILCVILFIFCVY